MRKPTRRSCKICKTKFTATYDNVLWCCPEHGAEYALQVLEKKREKQLADTECRIVSTKPWFNRNDKTSSWCGAFNAQN
ncbi:hypothetical protein [Citrobacter werkmanii]|uniref:hypothetical protein n=1 Tax=Citrobacter werkmanii TaxID=67827 RepID=UPI0034511E01